MSPRVQVHFCRTLLNVCAALSRGQKHREALLSAREAFHLLMAPFGIRLDSAFQEKITALMQQVQLLHFRLTREIVRRCLQMT